MKIGNLKTKVSTSALCDEEMVKTICDLLATAIKSLPRSRECEGIFTLRTQPRHTVTVPTIEQISFETLKKQYRRERPQGDYDIKRTKIGNPRSCREALDNTILAASKATCDFFPLRSAMRVMMPREEWKKQSPLPTGYYIADEELINGGPIVMVLRTAGGTFFAGFMANSFDQKSVNNAHSFAIYLFSSLINILCALSSDEDKLMNLGAAELLDLPPCYPETFKPNLESGLACFDEKNPFFKTIRMVDKTMTAEFLEEVNRRRFQIFENRTKKIRFSP